MPKRYGIRSLNDEFYHYGNEHKDMMSWINDAIHRVLNYENFDNHRDIVDFYLLEVRDDMDYKHRMIKELIKEVSSLRKELYGRKK